MRPGAGRSLLMGAVALAALFLLAGSAAADEGPHGGFTETTGKCEACHSPHRASSAFILRGGSGTVYSFCITCHGTGGDARTDVLSGQWVSGNAVYGIPDSYGDSSKQLNGGRFTGATGTHTVNTESTGLTMWGFNSDGTDATMSGAFRCTTCHDPHGKSLESVGGTGTQANGRTDNYRLLNFAAIKSWESEANYGAGVSKSYTRAGWQPGGMTNFCNTCHADYAATEPASNQAANRPSGAKWAHQVDMFLINGIDSHLDGSDYKLPVDQTTFNKYYSVDLSTPTGAGAAVITRPDGTTGHYGAGTDKLACTTCHNPHGSVAVENPSYAGNAAGDPSLIRFDNRTICQSCHRKGV